MGQFRMISSRLFVITGNASSGKDEIIRAVQSLGGFHAQVVPKYTTRQQHLDDGNEIICKTLLNGEINQKYIDGEKECDIVYVRNSHQYKINSSAIWEGLKNGLFQVIAVSEADTINKLKSKFGSAVVLIYVHSHLNTENNYELNLFTKNFDKFNHVLIYEGIQEDLFDQMFRLFRAYEKGFII